MSSTAKTDLNDFSTTERAILLALHEVQRRPIQVADTGHLWVQKVSFLFRKLLESISPEEGPASAGYIAYDLGPYSEEVEGALLALLKDKILAVDEKKRFHLTQQGILVAKKLELAKPKASSALRSIVDVVEFLEPDELVLYVYAVNPEWAKESKIKGILNNNRARLDLARKLYNTKKVSAERAAEVAGLPVKEFLPKL